MTSAVLAWSVVMVTVGLAALVNGVQTWRGVEPPAVDRYERMVGTWPKAAGTRRKYQTLWGAGFLGVPGGVGFVIAAVGGIAGVALGRGSEWVVSQAAVAAGTALAAATAVLTLAYFTRGLPDAWRPACQRGWEMVAGHRVLLRPGGTVRQRRERRAISPDDGNRRPSNPAWN